LRETNPVGNARIDWSLEHCCRNKHTFVSYSNCVEWRILIRKTPLFGKPGIAAVLEEGIVLGFEALCHVTGFGFGMQNKDMLLVHFLRIGVNVRLHKH
jgi:hypothetical protein